MKDLPTAEEIIAKIVKFESTNDTIECTVYSLSQLMIEFAKMHVTAALKNASEKISDKNGKYIMPNKEFILISYPLEKIK